jgi:large-conductance mechanosensitive channel
MSATGNTFWSDRADARKWIGRIVMAVIFGEAIWHLIASLMDYVVVPWLGDLMGQSSGLPTSFTQRPYDYPDLFVSVLEFCIAAIVAISINWYFQRPGKSVRVQARPAALAVPQAAVAAPAVVPAQPIAVAPVPEYREVVTAPVVAPPPAPVTSARVAPPPPKPVGVAAPPSPPRTPAPQVVVAAPAPVVTKSTPAPTPASQPAKKKEVYYNIVGEPVSDDED